MRDRLLRRSNKIKGEGELRADSHKAIHTHTHTLAHKVALQCAFHGIGQRRHIVPCAWQHWQNSIEPQDKMSENLPLLVFEFQNKYSLNIFAIFSSVKVFYSSG